MGVRLEVVEAAAPLEVIDNGLRDVRRLLAAQPAEPLDVAPVLVDRPDRRQPERCAELVVLGAGAGRDVDDARALVLTDLVPKHDPVLVGRVPERLADGGQIVERPLVAPAGELAAELLLLDPELADDCRLEDAPSDPERLVALPDPDVAQFRTDRRGDVRSERPWRRRPHEQ